MLPADDRRAEIFRRALLAMSTALIVARPLVLGEDPGLNDRLSDTAGLILSVFWFMTAAAWAAWRAWFRQGTRFIGLVELGLIAVVALVFLSTYAAAHYTHPALLIACEWLILLLVFCLVRQLASRPEDLKGLLAVLLATSVSLSVHAVYQSAVELPHNRAVYEDPKKVIEDAAKIGQYLAPDDPHLQFWKARFQMDHAFATFAHPNGFAGYLALLFPVGAGWALISWRRRTDWQSVPARRTDWQSVLPNWRFFATFACALLLGIALWLTHSRGAILGALLAGGAALAFYLRQQWWPYKAWVLAGLGVLFVGGLALRQTEVGAQALNKAMHSFGLRTEYWGATWNMIRDHLWLGVGPGNFGRHYLRYKAATAFETVTDPHNFVLELWATCGIFAILALLITLGIFFKQTWSVVRSPWSVVNEDEPRTTEAGPRIRWDLYIGGMAGLVLAFILRAGELSAEELPREAALSAVRSLVWFAVFALLEGIPWTGPSRTLALTAGVAALLLNLCVSGGIAWPSVAQPLWIMAALALVGSQARENGVHGSSSPTTQYSVLGTRYSALWRFLPLPILAGFAVAYVLLVYSPVTRSAIYLAEARDHYGDDPRRPGWRNFLEPNWRMQMKAEPGANKEKAAAGPLKYLQEKILKPLKFAAGDDPGDSVPPLQLSYWYLEEWKLFASVEKWKLQAEDAKTFALGFARLAQKLDPDNKECYLHECEFYKTLGGIHKERAREYFGQAAKALAEVVKRDPTEARLHYDLAEILYMIDDRVGGRQHAERALDLDKLEVPGRQLTETQRLQAKKWLADSPGR